MTWRKECAPSRRGRRYDSVFSGVIFAKPLIPRQLGFPTSNLTGKETHRACSQEPMTPSSLFQCSFIGLHFRDFLNIIVPLVGIPAIHVYTRRG